MSNKRGVFSLNKYTHRFIRGKTDTPDDVWIFPDGDGPEYKFIDGIVTPAPPATPLGPTYKRVSTNYNKTINFTATIRGIYCTDDYAILVTRSNTKSILIYKRNEIFLYDPSSKTYTISDDPSDYPNPNTLRTISFSSASTDEYWGGYVTVDPNNNKICVSSSTGAQLWNFDGTGHITVTKTIAENPNFGSICAIGNGKLVIGAPQENITYGATNYLQAGAIYVYDLDGTNELKITPSANAITRGGTITYNAYYMEFGYSVAISGNRIIVGAPGGSETSIRRYNGEIFTYTLSGGNETWHFAQDPDLAENSYGNEVTDNDRLGRYVYAKDDIFFAGTGLCDEQASTAFSQSGKNSGVVYRSSIPSQSSMGEYIMPGVYKDWGYNDLFQSDDYFGNRVSIGSIKQGSFNIDSTIYLAYAYGRRRLYYSTILLTGAWTAISQPIVTTSGAEPQLNPPFDSIDKHIIVGSDYLSTENKIYLYSIDNNPNSNSQMMGFPPLL